MLFKEIVGQEKIKNRLIQTVRENRVSHAQLFLGPEGCGKLALAIAYAQFINCTNKQENDSCGVCPSCIKYQKLIHPDLHFLYPIGSNKEKPLSKNYLSEWRELLEDNDQYVSLQKWYEAIDMENKQGIINAHDCNDVIKTLSLKAYESEYKVMIIWMVEKLFHSAAPKLLKILEEPPDKTLFILISENHDQILNTISSRAQLVKIPRITDKDLMEALVRKYQASASVAKNIIPFANGNLIDALEMTANTDEEEKQIQKFREWMLMCHKGNAQAILPWIDELAKTGREKIKRFISVGLQVLRYSLEINYGDPQMVKSDEENKSFLLNFSKLLNGKNTPVMVEEFNKAMFHIERNGNAKIIFFDLSLKIRKLINP